MANDINAVIISGRLGKNPVLKTSAKGTPFVSFSLANNRQTDFGEQTSWFNALAWGQELALPVSRRIAKGQHVTIVGQLETTYNKETGQHYFGLVAEDVNLTTNPGKPKDVNRVTIAGRLGRDAEFKLVGKNADKPMLSFSIANSSEDEYSEKTCWVNVVVWEDYALELSKVKLTRGQHVTVTGHLETRSVSRPDQNQTENIQRQLFGQVVASHIAVNDRSNYKRNSGAGNGAEKFAHYRRPGKSGGGF
jgi:single-stranded DNA-binding protein